MRHKIGMALAATALLVAACSGGAEATPDLEVDRSTGYVVIVDQRGDLVSIGFSADRDASAGIEYDVSQAVWRAGNGPWIEPPVTCLGKGQRVELGITQVENEARPGLLNDRVVWVACLEPEDA